MNDVELMQRIAARDQNALHALYERYGKAVYSLAYRILQNTVLAEEVTQDTFLKVWQQSTHWDAEKGKLKNWLLKIAQFGAIDRLRQERRQPNLLPNALEDSDETTLLDPNASGWQRESLIKVLMTQLPPEQVKLIELAFFQGMSHGDIAAVTNIPLGTVKTRLRAGLQHLRALWLESVNPKSEIL